MYNYISIVSHNYLRKIEFPSIGKITKQHHSDIIHFKKITVIDFIGEIRWIRTPMSESGAVVVIQHGIFSAQIHACTCYKYINVYFIHELTIESCTNFKSFNMIICSWNICLCTVTGLTMIKKKIEGGLIR